MTKEMVTQSFAYTTLMEQQTVTNSALLHGLCAMTVNQQYTAHSGSPPQW